MLRPEQIELIHQEIDGESTPESSAAFRALVERDPEARAMAGELREIVALLGRVEQRPTPPQLRHAIVAALQAARPSPAASRWMSLHAFVRWSKSQVRTATTRMEESMMTRKALLIGCTVVAAVAVIAVAVIGVGVAVWNQAGSIRDVTIDGPAYGVGYPLHGGLAGPSRVGQASTIDLADHYGAGYPLHGGLAGPSRLDSGD